MNTLTPLKEWIPSFVKNKITLPQTATVSVYIFVLDK